MTIRTLPAALQTSLLENDSFVYAHLVKFEKPVNESGNIPSRKASSYTYITDSAYPISYDDGSVNASGNSNGTQIYMPNRLLKVSDITETTEARASTFNLTIAANAIGTSTSTLTINVTGGSTPTITIQSGNNTDFVELGFIEGHEIDVVAGSETATVRINYFQTDNRVANTTLISGSLTNQTSVNGSFALNNPDISGLLADKDAGGYARYINREVFIYKAHIDIDDGSIIGTPFLIFKGILNSGKFTEDPVKGSTAQWGVSSHWGDFITVNGRRTDDESHRALKADGTPDLPVLIRPEYASDLGFIHSEQAINIIAIYQQKETEIDIKVKKKWYGSVKVKKEEREVLVPREVDLRFNLDSKYLPVVYGVQKIDSIPFFVDTDNNDAAKVYVAYALCEGEIQGLYDIYFEDVGSICLNKQDFDARSTQTAENTVPVLCTGRMDRGDVLEGQTASSGRSIFPGQGVGSIYSNGWFGSGYYVPEDIVRAQVDAYFAESTAPSTSSTNSNPASGVIHEKGRTFNDPIDCRLTFHAGRPNQKADVQLVNKAADGTFKLQNDYFESDDKASYWGPNHRVLDTAYCVAQYTINEGETEIPSLEFTVKGRIIECYNYDYSYVVDTTKTSASLSNFQLATSYDIYNGNGSDSNVNAQIQWMGTIPDENGTEITRVRLNKKITSDTDFSIRNGGNILYLTTYDHVYLSGSGSAIIQEQVSSVATAAETGHPGVDFTIPSGDLSNIIGSEDIRIALLDSSYASYVSTVDLENLNALLGSYSTSNTSASTSVTSVGPTNTNSSQINYAVAKNAVKLPGSPSATDDTYNGLLLEASIAYADGSKYSVTRKIVDYDGGRGIAIVDQDFEPDKIPNGVSWTIKVKSRGDRRVSTNPAMQLLDYLTNTRYGRGLELDQDLDLDSFFETGRKCDRRSDVFVYLSSGTVAVNDNLTYSSGGRVFFKGKVESKTTVGSLTRVKLTNCVGKLGRKWEDWKTFVTGEPYWSKGVVKVATSTATQTEPTGSSDTISLTNSNGGGTVTVSTADAAFDGNPLVKFYSSRNNWIDGYTLYDSDSVSYWRYLGWDYQEQEYVTRHQTNFVIRTETSVFENVNAILGHFGGILRYTDGKYQLAIKDVSETLDSVTANSTTYYPTRITKDDILGSINIEDPGTKGTFNTVSVEIPDPGNRFSNRSVTFLDSNYLKQDRNIPRKGDVKTPGITNYFNSRLNAKQYLEESRYGVKINFTLPPKGYFLLAGEIIRVKYDNLGFDDKLFRVTNVSLSENCLVRVTAEEHTDAAYRIGDPTSSSRGGVGLPVELTVANIGAPTPVSDLTATTTTAGGAIELAWTAPTGFNSDYDSFEIWAGTSPLFTGNSPSTDDAVLLTETKSTAHIHFLPVSDPSTTVSRYYWIRVKRQKSVDQVLRSAYYPSLIASPLPEGVLGTTAVAASGAQVYFSNTSPQIDRNTSPIDYADTTGNITVKLAGTSVPYNNGASPQGNFTFDVSISSTTGITAGALTADITSPIDSNVVEIGEASAWDETTVVPKVTYSVVVKDVLGNTETFVITQNFGLTALPGTAGTSGRNGVALTMTLPAVNFVYNSSTELWVPDSTSTPTLEIDGITNETKSFSQSTSYGSSILTLASSNGLVTFNSSGISTSDLNTINASPVGVTATITDGVFSDGSTFSTSNSPADEAFTVTAFLPVTARGLPGQDGDPAKAVSIDASKYVIAYDSSGTLVDSSNITITANSKNFSDAYFKFTGDGFTDETSFTDGTGQNQDTLTWSPPASYSSSPYTITVEVQEGSSGGTVASDSLTISSVKEAANGTNGTNNATVEIFAVSNSSSSAPALGFTSTLTYTFGGTLSDTSPGNYFTNAPDVTSSNPYLWKRVAVASSTSSTDTIAYTEWSAGVLVGAFGDDGVAGGTSAIVEIFAVSSSNSSAPSLGYTGNLTYTFSTGLLSDTTPGNWSQTPPSVTAANPYLWKRIATAFGAQGATTDTISTSDWSGGAVVGTFGEEGKPAITISFVNETHSFTANSSGVVSDYTGSGTEISVYEGATSVPYDGSAPYATPSYRVSGITGTNITPDTTRTASGNTSLYGPHSNMSDTTASIEYTITVVDSDGDTTTYTKIQTFSRSDAGVAGAAGGPGFFFLKRSDTGYNQGLSAPSSSEIANPANGNVAIVENSYSIYGTAVKLTTTSQTAVYDGSGSPDPDPSTTTMTATTTGFTGSPYYEFLVNGVSQVNSTTSTYTYTFPTTHTTNPDEVTVRVRETETGDILAEDVMSMHCLLSGGTSVSIVLDNEQHTFATASDGTLTTTGSSTDIDVYIGSSQLSYDGSSPYANSTYRVFRTYSFLTDSTASTDGTTYTSGDHDTNVSPESDHPDVAAVTYIIDIVDANGVASQYSVNQIIKKSIRVDSQQLAYKYVNNAWETVDLIRAGVLAADAVTATQLAISNLTDVPAGKESGIFMDATNLRIQIFSEGVERVRIGKLS
jgi:hypothetical protein